jgi:hypothetical protein
MARVPMYTGPGVFEVLARVCRNPQEALKQFVENAADTIDHPGIPEGHIQIKLEYTPAKNGDKQGSLKQISIHDNGMGMTREKMRDVLNHIGDSEKVDLALRGEQGIGLLAFGLIAEEVHLASSPEAGSPSSCLVFKRPWLKKGYAEIIEHCAVHQHSERGTVAYLENILPEVASQLSKERIKLYLGQQFASDLKANLYTMAISDGGEPEQIHSQRFRGVKVMSSNLPLGDHLASAFIELYVLPWEMPDAGIELYGRKGTLICAITDLADFKRMPWLDQRLEGYVRCDKLKRTADKTAVVQDEVYRALVNELRKMEPQVQRLVMDVSAESLERRFNIIMQRAGRLIDKFMRYKEKGLLATLALPSSPAKDSGESERRSPLPQPVPPSGVGVAAPSMRAARVPYIKLNSPPGDRLGYRSWYDSGEGIICINREHSEFLLSQREDRRCLRYLFSIWAKESLLQEFGADAEKVADELVGVLAEAEPLLW